MALPLKYLTLSVKTKISLLVVRYQGSNVCQKNQQNLKNTYLEVYCVNIQPKLKKKTTKFYQKSIIFNSFLRFLEVHSILAEY